MLYKLIRKASEHLKAVEDTALQTLRDFGSRGREPREAFGVRAHPAAFGLELGVIERSKKGLLFDNNRFSVSVLRAIPRLQP